MEKFLLSESPTDKIFIEPGAGQATLVRQTTFQLNAEDVKMITDFVIMVEDDKTIRHSYTRGSRYSLEYDPEYPEGRQFTIWESSEHKLRMSLETAYKLVHARQRSKEQGANEPL